MPSYFITHGVPNMISPSVLHEHSTAPPTVSSPNNGPPFVGRVCIWDTVLNDSLILS
jgi:hypothetical protein